MLFMLETSDALVFCPQRKAILPNWLREVRFDSFFTFWADIQRENEKKEWSENVQFVQVCLPIGGHFHWIGIAKTRWHENIRLQFALYIHIDELLPIWLGVPAHPVERKSSLRLKYHLWIIKIISGVARKASKHIVRMKPNKFKSIINISCFMQNEYHCEPSELPAWNSSVLAQSTTISLTYFYATFDFFFLKFILCFDYLSAH